MTDATAMPAPVPPDAAVLDRFEVDAQGAALAVLLVGPGEAELVVARASLPEGSSEGDWFRLDLTPDVALTAQRREELSERMARIRATRRGGRFA
jgi:hypothetical protein